MTAPWPPPDGWVIPSQPRIPSWSLYVAHYSAGIWDEGSVRILCSEWSAIGWPIRPTWRQPYCLACARLMPREPEQLDMLAYLEEMTS